MDRETLLNKLKSMGVQVGSNLVPPAVKQQEKARRIENVITGYDFSTIYGTTFVTVEHFLPDYQHGNKLLIIDQEMDILSAWCQSSRILQPKMQNVVFLDTETSGLNGGTGTYAFLIGIGYRTEAGFEIVQFFLREPAEETALLTALDNWLSRFNLVVTFNGKSFDLPLLKTRYLMNGLSSPFSNFEHIDVLQLSRKIWRDRLESRALGDLEKEILQFFRTADDVPGWMIPQMYFDYLRTGDARPLTGIFYHNSIDILTLAVLFNYIAEIVREPMKINRSHGLDIAAIAKLYDELGMLEQAANLYERCLEEAILPEQFYLRTIDRYANLLKHQSKWKSAVALWQKGAEHGLVSACIELSKYFEHRQRNSFEALIWAKKALENLEKMDPFDYPEKSLEKSIHIRIGRLTRRLYREFDNER